ncbi:NUDIX domain-containing protein [Halomonas sp.]|uniref:NUDIX domain-containing protein n=1 Tax=Halomonas sp. TaxID=1486246 RepID=UPI0035634E02
MPESLLPLPLRPIPAVSAAVIRHGRILMVRRRNPPNAGRLALPGGKIEMGESLYEAAARELEEETGIQATPIEVITAIDVMHVHEGELLAHFVIVVIGMAWQGGIEAAGDDATELSWMDATSLQQAGDDVSETAARVAYRVLEEASGKNNR